MKTVTHSSDLTACPPLIRTPTGGGGGPNRKTNIAAGIGASLKRKRGGQTGNRNAATPIGTLSARIRDLKRRAKAAIALTDLVCEIKRLQAHDVDVGRGFGRDLVLADELDA